MERLMKEFKLELIENKRTNKKYVKVTNRETQKVNYVWFNDNKVCFCGHDVYLETTGKELINNL